MDIAEEAGDDFKEKGSGAKLKTEVPGTDQYRIEVRTLAGSGVYQLKVKWKPVTKTVIDQPVEIGEDGALVPIAVDPGSLVTHHDQAGQGLGRRPVLRGAAAGGRQPDRPARRRGGATPSTR